MRALLGSSLSASAKRKSASFQSPWRAISTPKESWAEAWSGCWRLPLQAGSAQSAAASRKTRTTGEREGIEGTSKRGRCQDRVGRSKRVIARNSEELVYTTHAGASGPRNLPSRKLGPWPAGFGSPPRFVLATHWQQRVCQEGPFFTSSVGERAQRRPPTPCPNRPAVSC